MTYQQLSNVDIETMLWCLFATFWTTNALLVYGLRIGEKCDIYEKRSVWNANDLPVRVFAFSELTKLLCFIWINTCMSCCDSIAGECSSYPVFQQVFNMTETNARNFVADESFTGYECYTGQTSKQTFSLSFY